MSTSAGCREVQELAAELALDIADGEERAGALRHLAGCDECRRHVHALSDTADELLRLAPPTEPPAGFESGVLERITADATRARPPRRRHRRRLRPWLAVVPGAALAAAAAAAFVVYTVTERDREMGKLYRQSLAVANGKGFGALPLRGRDGRRAGTAFGYEGKPSWLFVVVRRRGADGRFDVEIETRRGARRKLGRLRVKDGRGSFGAVLPVRLFDVGRIRVAERGMVFSVVVPPPPPILTGK